MKSDSFAEKMATNVIKNLQVTVSDIHIRYEDRYTNPKRPVALGVTLKELQFQVSVDLTVCLKPPLRRGPHLFSHFDSPAPSKQSVFKS